MEGGTKDNINIDLKGIKLKNTNGYFLKRLQEENLNFLKK